jgi:uncharacterized protein (TIGR02145 family)
MDTRLNRKKLSSLRRSSDALLFTKEENINIPMINNINKIVIVALAAVAVLGIGVAIGLKISEKEGIKDSQTPVVPIVATPVTEQKKVDPCGGVSSIAGVGGLPYNTVVGPDGRCWLDRNLGAAQVATFSADKYSFGYLYQWGRGNDGHQLVTSSAIDGQSSLTTPGAKFLFGYRSDNWYAGDNLNLNALWQGVSGINNPCPTGFRVPTQTEWASFASFLSSQTNENAFASTLKLPLGGSRGPQENTLNSQGRLGFYWSSTPRPDTINNSYMFSLVLQGGMNAKDHAPRSVGFSVRCIKD